MYPFNSIYLVAYFSRMETFFAFSDVLLFNACCAKIHLQIWFDGPNLKVVDGSNKSRRKWAAGQVLLGHWPQTLG